MTSANQTPRIVTITTPGPRGIQGPPGYASSGSNTYLGDQIITGSILISGSIIPNVGTGELTSSFSLGSETAAWKDIYVSNGSIKFVTSGSNAVTISAKEGGISVNGGTTISANGVSGQFLTSKSLDTTITVKDSNNSLLMGPIDIETDKEIVVEEGSDLTIFGDIEAPNLVDKALFADSSSFSTSASFSDSSSYSTTADNATYAVTAGSVTNATSASYTDTASYALTSSYINTGTTQIYDGNEITYISSERLAILASNALSLTSTNGINFNSATNFSSVVRAQDINTSGGFFVVDPIAIAPTFTGTNGQIVPMFDGVNYKLYIYLNGTWKSASLS